MKFLPLAQNKFAVVDDSDFDLVSKYSWYLKKGRTTHYAYCVDGGKNILLHRFILKPQKHQQIDHINYNGLDNRRSNIRICTGRENVAYSRQPVGPSGFRGVCFDKMLKSRPWKARLHYYGKGINLGRFKTKEEAALAYNAAALKHNGEFAILNKIEI